MTRKEFARKLRQNYRRKVGHINPLPEEADERLDAAEARLEFPLPPMVRFIYKHAGEDFFSPEWSAEQYAKWRADPDWPERMLPLVEEGCGIWLCLDCSRKQAPVLKYRGDYATEVADLHFEHESPSFAEWLRQDLPRDEGGYASGPLA